MQDIDDLPKILADLDKRSPPDILYHYTNQRGLLGILKDKCIWATQVQHLNDQQELVHALNLAREQLEARLAAPTVSNSDTLVRIKETLQHLEDLQIGVASFSCEGDLLSQWRAYGGSTGGFAIGFSGPGLRQYAATDDVTLLRCEYDPDAQKSIVSAIIDHSVAAKVDDTTTTTIIRESIRWLQYAPLLKSAAFEAEREWRLVTGPFEAYDKRLGFREGRTMIAPYLRISLEEVEIKGIYIGPTVRPQESRRAVQKLVGCYHSSKATVPVYLSKVPYRNW